MGGRDRRKGAPMTEPITLTLNDLWLFLLAFAGGLSTISAGIAVIVNVIHKAKEPNKKQDERISALESDVKKINERLEQGNQRFESDANKLAELEKSMKNSNRIILESLQALTAHAIDGNNIDQLRKSEQALNDYLLDKI